MDNLLSQIDDLKGIHEKMVTQRKEIAIKNISLTEQKRNKLLQDVKKITGEADMLIEIQKSKGTEKQMKKQIALLNDKLDQKQNIIIDLKKQNESMRNQLIKQIDNSKELKKYIQQLKNQLSKKMDQSYLSIVSDQSKIRQEQYTPQGQDVQNIEMMQQNYQFKKILAQKQRENQQVLAKLLKNQHKIFELLEIIEEKDQKIKELRTSNEKLNQILQKQAQRVEISRLQIYKPYISVINQVKQIQQPNIAKYCNNTQGVIIKGSNIQNIYKAIVILHYCQPFNLRQDSIKTSSIRLNNQSEVHFGLMSQKYREQVMKSQTRTLMYYNNCNGVVVSNRKAIIISKYATKGDVVTINVMIKPKEKITYLINDKIVYTAELPDYFKKCDTLYPFLRLHSLANVDVIYK